MFFWLCPALGISLGKSFVTETHLWLFLSYLLLQTSANDSRRKFRNSYWYPSAFPWQVNSSPCVHCCWVPWMLFCPVLLLTVAEGKVTPPVLHVWLLISIWSWSWSRGEREWFFDQNQNIRYPSEVEVDRSAIFGGLHYKSSCLGKPKPVVRRSSPKMFLWTQISPSSMCTFGGIKTTKSKMFRWVFDRYPPLQLYLCLPWRSTQLCLIHHHQTMPDHT